jgi:hypothetical protein
LEEREMKRERQGERQGERDRERGKEEEMEREGRQRVRGDREREGDGGRERDFMQRIGNTKAAGYCAMQMHRSAAKCSASVLRCIIWQCAAFAFRRAVSGVEARPPVWGAGRGRGSLRSR